MEITSGNFTDSLERVQKSIRTCNFLAFDCEFSGLGVVEQAGIKEEDLDIDIVYQNVKKRVGDYEVIQMGISTFHQKGKSLEYEAHTYNFYVFPSTIRSRPNKQFISQPSAIKFLASQSFDFNKLFYYGIPYLSKKDEDELRAVRTKELDGDMVVIDIDERGQAFLDNAINDIEEWYNAKEDTGYMTVASPSAYCRRLLYQVIREKYDKKIIASGSKYGVRLNKYTQGAQDKDMAFRRKRLEDELADLIGFRKVIDMIIEAKKPIIGHNLFMDICHIMKQFLVDELPDNLTKFLAEAHPRFPKVFDTKFLFEAAFNFKSANIHDSSLSSLVTLVSEQEFQLPKVGFHYEFNKYQNGKNFTSYHEAGYDSYVTGMVFIKLITKAASLAGETDLSWKHLSKLPLVQDNINKIHLSRGCHHSLNLGTGKGSRNE